MSLKQDPWSRLPRQERLHPSGLRMVRLWSIRKLSLKLHPSLGAISLAIRSTCEGWLDFKLERSAWCVMIGNEREFKLSIAAKQ